ncbi:MAG: sensor domain-containing diguanylate cyclase [Gammaproteobacteria bacterium (ex Lamellibrachia satsuma)]|nr:MAG: sensor domain-containing diguanylate cyclase [Gammaproteobacteria bacterium (ex Lamellibrachia satsuma)]
MRSLEQENRMLRQRLLELGREALHNENTFKRFHQRELELLSANSLPELLNSMTDGLQDSFQVKAIQLIIEDQEHDIRRLLYNTGIPEDAFPLVRFVDQIDSVNREYATLQRPRLGPFLSPDHDSLFSSRSELRSIAILPIFCRNRLIGSLNLGSTDSKRFTRHHGSDFLHRLAAIGGVCLENAVNRERLIISGLTDALTGMHNRRYLDRRLKEELARANRYRQPMSCLFIDADHFKQVNDGHGHQAGDTVLRELASRIRSQLRASDVATRYGGEEFTLLLPQTSLDEAKLLAERIRLEISNHPITLDSGEQIPLTVSIGISEALPTLGKASLEQVGEHLLATADEAVYRAKNNGRNRVEHCREDVRQQLPVDEVS